MLGVNIASKIIDHDWTLVSTFALDLDHETVKFTVDC